MQKNKSTAHLFTVLIFIVMIVLGFMGVPPFSIIGIILLIAVVCTAGIGLVVVVPVVAAIYMAIFKIICKIMGVKVDPKKITISSNKELSLIGYIVNSRAGAVSDTTIRANLKSAGWQDADVENAFKKSVLTT